MHVPDSLSEKPGRAYGITARVRPVSGIEAEADQRRVGHLQQPYRSPPASRRSPRSGGGTPSAGPSRHSTRLATRFAPSLNAARHRRSAHARPDAARELRPNSVRAVIVRENHERPAAAILAHAASSRAVRSAVAAYSSCREPSASASGHERTDHRQIPPLEVVRAIARRQSAGSPSPRARCPRSRSPRSHRARARRAETAPRRRSPSSRPRSMARSRLEWRSRA